MFWGLDFPHPMVFTSSERGRNQELCEAGAGSNHVQTERNNLSVEWHPAHPQEAVVDKLKCYIPFFIQNSPVPVFTGSSTPSFWNQHTGQTLLSYRWLPSPSPLTHILPLCVLYLLLLWCGDWTSYQASMFYPWATSTTRSCFIPYTHTYV